MENNRVKFSTRSKTNDKRENDSTQSHFQNLAHGGIWTPWGPWSDCIGQACDVEHSGSQVRMRICAKPDPMRKESWCPLGENSQKLSCTPTNCGKLAKMKF